KAGPRRFEQLSWEEALDEVERILREGAETTVTALSGGESLEEAYALGRLMRQGLQAQNAVLPEEPIEPGGSPLSALRAATSIAALPDAPGAERAPVAALWRRAARRAGATVTYTHPHEAVDAVVTDDPANLADVEATHTYVLPLTPNGHGIADAWSAAGDEDPTDREPLAVVISGDEAALNEDVRPLAAQAPVVIGTGMFEWSFHGITDVVVPGTSYLERDGTTVNLEGRLQRQRRAVLPPVPDVLAWIAKLAERFDVALSPHASVVFEEVAGKCYGDVSF